MKKYVLIMLLTIVSQVFGLHLDVTQGKVDPIPIAVTPFQGKNTIGSDISTVINANLERSGLFKPIDKAAYIQNATVAHTSVRYEDWRLINAHALVTGKAFIEGDTIKVEYKLYDIFAEKMLDSKIFTTSVKNWRRIAHMVSDAIYERLTGEQGYFDTRIVYIAESGPEKKKVKRLAIMDVDGHNHHFISDGKQLVLTPRFSPSTQLVTYVAYPHKSQAHVYILNLRTGKRKILGHFKGMTFASRFSPDGKSIIMSSAKGGATCIYTIDLTTGLKKQITQTAYIDTSPSFSPDSKRIVFNSDRGGTPQLYTMNADGSNIQRISFGEGRYGTPVWSPRGDLIAFTKIMNGSFYIGVMRPDGTSERMLAQGYLVEGPTWSPNGRVLMYTKEMLLGRKTVSKLYSVDLTGYNEREVMTPLEASDPAWSPLLTKESPVLDTPQPKTVTL